MKISEIRKLYDKRDAKHGWRHILSLKKRVVILRKPYLAIDKRLLFFLINFHGQKEYVTQHKNRFDKEYVKFLLRHNTNPRKIEEKLVFDANMLDNVGKSGIKKALYVGKRLGRSNKETYKHLRKQLKKARFYTIEGKKLGRKKLNEMKSILDYRA